MLPTLQAHRPHQWLRCHFLRLTTTPSCTLSRRMTTLTWRLSHSHSQTPMKAAAYTAGTSAFWSTAWLNQMRIALHQAGRTCPSWRRPSMQAEWEGEMSDVFAMSRRPQLAFTRQQRKSSSSSQSETEHLALQKNLYYSIMKYISTHYVDDFWCRQLPAGRFSRSIEVYIETKPSCSLVCLSTANCNKIDASFMRTMSSGLRATSEYIRWLMACTSGFRFRPHLTPILTLRSQLVWLETLLLKMNLNVMK